jgi:tRNA nucleotidyltransferase (CCA-adding enzyme)
VRPGTISDDLARRDFTVNAISVPLGGPQRGMVVTVEHALDDLLAGRLRVLHARSFIEDPTRLLRLARYSARLRFDIEEATARLAREAIATRALDTVSGARIAAELRLVTEEPNLDAFTILGELGVLEALGLPARFDVELYMETLDLLPPDGVHEIVDMAVLFHPAHPPATEERRAAAQLMERYEFFAETREEVLAGAFDSFALADEIEKADTPSRLHRALVGRRVEAIAIAGALGGRREPEIAQRARTWLDELREVKLEITGADLLAAGVAEGPEIGRRLQRALDQRLDGEIAAGRQAELRAALEGEP